MVGAIIRVGHDDEFKMLLIFYFIFIVLFGCVYLCFCVCFYIYRLHCLESGSNLTDSCIAGEFVAPLLLLSQNNRKWRRVGVLGDCLVYIDDKKVLIISLI